MGQEGGKGTNVLLRAPPDRTWPWPSGLWKHIIYGAKLTLKSRWFKWAVGRFQCARKELRVQCGIVGTPWSDLTLTFRSLKTYHLWCQTANLKLRQLKGAPSGGKRGQRRNNGGPRCFLKCHCTPTTFRFLEVKVPNKNLEIKWTKRAPLVGPRRSKKRYSSFHGCHRITLINIW